MNRFLCCLMAASGLGLGAACADEPPRFLPTQDVAVTYSVSAPGRPDATYQLRYNAAQERARIDDPVRGNFFLADLPRGTAELVVPVLHSVVDAPDMSDLTRQLADAGGARFTPLGRGHYAGLECDKYLVLGRQGSARTCLTRDGVILYFAGQNQRGSATVTATSVAYGPEPPSIFLPPPDFGRVDLPPGVLAQLLGQAQGQ